MGQGGGTEHRIGVLDGWRGLAIIGVLIDHFVTAEFINLGRFGVELFFVLSGGLMAEILFVRRAPLPSFFQRRFTRIYPALFVFATILFLVAQTAAPFMISPAVYLASLAFAINYASIVWTVTPALDHLWSLAIEEHAYILLGLLAACGRHLPRLPILWIIAALAGLAILNGLYETSAWHGHYHNVYRRTDVRGASILIGAAVQLWVRGRGAGTRLLGRPLTPVLCALVGLALNINAVPDPLKYSLGTLCLAIAVATLATAPAPVKAVLESRILRLFGVGSFSLYLWQQPFALIADPALRVASFAVIALIAYCSYVGLERHGRQALVRLLVQRSWPAMRLPALGRRLEMAA